CDETRPGCQRCATAGIECPGYPQTRKFIDEGATVRRRYGPYQRNTPRAHPSTNVQENQNQNHAVVDSVSSPKPDSNPKPSETGLTASAGPDLQASLKSNLLENPSRDITSTESASNPAAFQPVAYPTALELPSSSISPSRSQQQQEAGLLTNSMSNDVQNAADFNGSTSMGPSALYDSTFNVPLDLTLASILDQAPYSTPLPSSTVLDQKNGQKEAADFFSELMVNSEREMAFLLRHFSEFIAPW
ncbi:C6 finger domain protein, partial [Rasamsonia emersonii CBS 393.64]